MNLNSLPPLKMLLLCFVVIFQFSCSKDSDLLTDYVISDTPVSKGIANLVVDDTYQVSLSGSIVLDVLANDTFENGAEVVISETSTPANGTVAINNDETLTYTPNAEIIEQVSDAENTAVGEVIDTFTYTAEVVTGEGTATTEEASVVITTVDDAAKQEGVNLSTYGAVGDGIKDDTAAIQNAFNNETNITSDAGKTYLISSALRIDKNMAQYIDFNGSTITTNSNIGWIIDIDKRNYSNTLTTIKNLEIDGNNVNSLQGVDIASRVDFSNIDIHDFKDDGLRGIRMLIYDLPGMYGQSVFDDVNMYNFTCVTNQGESGSTTGIIHAFEVSAQSIPTQTTQIVYKNSEISELWSESANAVVLNSPGRDTSNSPLSFWFENMHLKGAQRRLVKGFISNQTWINCTFTAADNDDPRLFDYGNPGGMISIGASSSATGATNNLFCGCTFEGNPSNPFDSWYTQFIIDGENGPAGAEIRNSSFTGGHGGRWSRNGVTLLRTVGDVSFINTTFGTTNTVENFGTVTGTLTFDTNNTYVDGKTTALANVNHSYTETNIAYEACPSIDD